MFYKLLTCTVLAALPFTAQAFDISPHKVGDDLTTEEARELKERYHSRPTQPWKESDEADIPAGPKGDLIREGIDILRNTSMRVGKNAPDPSKRMTWNNLNCVNCHQAGDSGLPGTRPYAMPLVNAVNDYPKLDSKSGKIISLEERIIGMFGPGEVKVTPESHEVKAITAYLEWLARDTKPGAAMKLTGLMPIKADGLAGSPERGEGLYEEKCSVCHGPNAMGVKMDDFDKGAGYQFPPIAGEDSYGNAGHMFAVPLLARYIYASMPFGVDYADPELTPQEALDIAAYINDDSTPRPQNSGRDKLYPDPAFRPQGFAIPENFDSKEDYLRAKNGPFKDVNEEY